MTFAADVAKASDVAAAVAPSVARWGEIDVLFSNAGNFGMVAPIADYPEDVFESVMAVHVRGRLPDVQACHAEDARWGQRNHHLQRRGRSRRRRRLWLYRAKHAQVGLMRCLAKELAPRRIRVNTIHPGPISTDFSTRSKRVSPRRSNATALIFLTK